VTANTYWHLEDADEPSEYEITTSRLLYYPERGFEIRSPVAEWCIERQAAAALQLTDWDRFSDPRRTTYQSYVEQAQARESALDVLLETIETTGYDASLSEEWGAVATRVLSILRFPFHGLQMTSAFIGSMAPSGRIAVAVAFQAADEMRLIQRLAYRVGQLQRRWPDLDAVGRAAWQEDRMWQPLRRSIEGLLCCYDWTRVLVVQSLLLKPILNELFLKHFGRLAAAHGDVLLEKLLQDLLEDQHWHYSWADAALSNALAVDDNRARVLEILAQHADEVTAVTQALQPLFDTPHGARSGVDSDRVLASLHASLRERRRPLSLVV
jgi:toluene monooxygenase system protein E